VNVVKELNRHLVEAGLAKSTDVPAAVLATKGQIGAITLLCLALDRLSKLEEEVAELRGEPVAAEPVAPGAPAARS
jgi:hypothetical protein